jgi:hypothetical protein
LHSNHHHESYHATPTTVTSAHTKNWC